MLQMPPEDLCQLLSAFFGISEVWDMCFPASIEPASSSVVVPLLLAMMVEWKPRRSGEQVTAFLKWLASGHSNVNVNVLEKTSPRHPQPDDYEQSDTSQNVYPSALLHGRYPDRPLS